MNEVDKAERMQAWKAFLIPASLFVACLFNAAGIYIIYSGNSVGVFFLGTGLTIIIVGMFLAFTFHNQHRAEGRWHKLPSDQSEAQENADEHQPDEQTTEDFSVEVTAVAQPVEPVARV